MMIRNLFFSLCMLVMTLGIHPVHAAYKNVSAVKEAEAFKSFAENLYQILNDKDLNYQAFETALKGYISLQKENKLTAEGILTIIDMSVSANKNRFFLIDLERKKVLYKSIVAHGRNSGGEYAKYFSNKIGSYKSSIGFYRTAETYLGKHGLSLRLDGLEFSNSNARKRAIVIHAADYVSKVFIEKNGRLGRSLGCPSLPKKNYNQIINTIKNGSLLFIYYPEGDYLKNSLLINTDLAMPESENGLAQAR